MPNPNLELLELAAERLRQILPEIVFVGGCATGLLIDDPAATLVRGTNDVDVIAEIGSYAEYTVFSERLRTLGFKEDSSEGAPLCRWIHGALTLDVMPLDSRVRDFSNRWYPEALRTAGNVQLPGGLAIRAINAPYFLGTKLEAFHGRGKRDYLASHDLEDFIAVVDGRSSLMTEIESASSELKMYITDSVRLLLEEHASSTLCLDTCYPTMPVKLGLGNSSRSSEGLRLSADLAGVPSAHDPFRMIGSRILPKLRDGDENPTTNAPCRQPPRRDQEVQCSLASPASKVTCYLQAFTH